MKTKILSKEALAAMTGKKTTETVAAEVEVEVKAAETVESEEKEVQVETEAAEGEDLSAKLAELTEAQTKMTEELEEAKAKVAELETAATETEAVVAELKENEGKLKEVVATATTSMRSVLGMADVDMSTMSTKDLLREHASAVKAFEKSLPVGSVTGSEVKTNSEAPAVSSLEASALRSLAF